MNLSNRIIYKIFKALAWGAQRLPRPLALALGAGFGGFIYGLYRLTPYRDFIANNIRVSYGSDLSEGEIHRIAKRSITSLTKCIAEVMRLPLLEEEMPRIVTFEGLEWFEEARKKGKGVILLTAHFGNWELLGSAIALQGYPMSVLVQTPSKAAFDLLFIEYRGGAGVRTFANHGVASLRPVMKALRDNEMLGLLCDQHGENQDAFATLFGHPVSVPASPFHFAQKADAAIIPAFIFRGEGDRHVIRFSPPLVAESPDDFARQACLAYEAAIRQAPDHWLWAHNRWERENELKFSPSPAGEGVGG